MPKGPVGRASVVAVDVQAPGAPGVSIQQTSNTGLQVTITPPTADADGSPLTGLTYFTGVVLPLPMAQTDQYVADLTPALQVPGAQPFTVAVVPNGPTIVPAAINQGFVEYTVLAQASDETIPTPPSP